MRVPGIAGSGDLTGGDLKRGVQAGGAVALVVVGHPLRLARLHRQRRLGAIQCLDLRLLIHAQHQRALRRVQVQARPRRSPSPPAAGSLENLNERTWCGLSLCSRQIRCTVVGEIPVASASRRTLQCVAAIRRRLERLGQHPLHLIVIDLPRPARPWRVPKSLQPPLTEVPSPQPNRGQRHPHLRAIWVLLAPSAARNTILARNACC